MLVYLIFIAENRERRSVSIVTSSSFSTNAAKLLTPFSSKTLVFLTPIVMKASKSAVRDSGGWILKAGCSPISQSPKVRIVMLANGPFL